MNGSKGYCKFMNHYEYKNFVLLYTKGRGGTLHVRSSESLEERVQSCIVETIYDISEKS